MSTLRCIPVGNRRRRGPRLFCLMLMLVAALIYAAPASAAPFSCGGGVCTWGYNYIGQNTNAFQSTGFDYWAQMYLNKTNNTGDVLYSWYHDAFHTCGADTGTGNVTINQTPGTLGCGGYLEFQLSWNCCGTAYLYAKVNT